MRSAKLPDIIAQYLHDCANCVVGGYSKLVSVFANLISLMVNVFVLDSLLVTRLSGAVFSKSEKG